MTRDNDAFSKLLQAYPECAIPTYPIELVECYNLFWSSGLEEVVDVMLAKAKSYVTDCPDGIPLRDHVPTLKNFLLSQCWVFDEKACTEPFPQW